MQPLITTQISPALWEAGGGGQVWEDIWSVPGFREPYPCLVRQPDVLITLITVTWRLGRRKPKINAERKQVVFEVASSPPLSHTRAQLPKEDGIPDLLCKSNGLRNNSANPLTNVPGGSAPQPEAQTPKASESLNCFCWTWAHGNSHSFRYCLVLQWNWVIHWKRWGQETAMVASLCCLLPWSQQSGGVKIIRNWRSPLSMYRVGGQPGLNKTLSQTNKKHWGRGP